MPAERIFHLPLPWANRFIHSIKHRGYQYQLHPSDEQATLFVQFAGVSGVCRLVYNVALEQRRDHWSSAAKSANLHADIAVASGVSALSP